MSRTIVKKKELQKLISESIIKRTGVNTPKLSIDFARMNEEINKVHNKIRIAIVKEEIKQLDIRSYKPILSESFYGTGSNRHHPGESAAAGAEELAKIIGNSIKSMKAGLQKAGKMIKDNELGKMIANSIIRLSNTMSVIGTYMGAGKSQRGVDDQWLYSQLTDIPFPDVEACEEGDDDACERVQKSFLKGM
jgi:hypothetical protein|tara:strand:- start:2881 stop:3456 length:576 start_codon:yes stop_codon:yes gene_type:complete